MSIFKDSFHPSVRDQLDTRQEAINIRTPQNLQYFNSRNAWIRLSSSVNVLKKGVESTPQNLVTASNYDNTLARKYILQGGILNDGNRLRAGLGDFSYAYSNTGADGEAYRLGIRPMPGITDLTIKSKGAYGSLRYATINFNAWDIKQLEDLELLYMRPGYSVMLEWGWAPYLDNKGQLTTTVDYTDIIDTDWKKEELFKRQYARATDGIYFREDGSKVEVTGYQGNCDSMFGIIKNYSWKARMDGGYDCSLEIISMGEVIESLKVNYAPMNNINEYSARGLVIPNLSPKKDGTSFTVTAEMDLSGSYTQNVLAGIFSEMWGIGLQLEGDSFGSGIPFVLHDKAKNSYYDMFRKVINIRGGEKEATGTGKIGQTDEQVYITLETLVNLLNNYVLLRDKKSGKPYTPLSVLEKNATNVNPITGDGYLLALAHPLEISVDPTVCLIKSPLWTKGIKINALPSGSGVDPNQGTPVAGPYGKTKNGTEIYTGAWWKELTDKITAANDDGANDNALITFVKSYVGTGPGAVEELKEIQRRFIEIKNAGGVVTANGKRYTLAAAGDAFTSYSNFYDLLDGGLFEVDIAKAIGQTDSNGNPTADSGNIFKAATQDPAETERQQLEAEKAKVDQQNQNLAEAVTNISFLNNLSRPYFLNNDYTTELGIIGNIFVNVNMLYNLSVSKELEAQDKKEKNDISVYDFMKQVLSRISSAIGEVNNFDIFIEPDTNVARIIDVNYVDRLEAETAYDRAFELQIHNLNSVVRSYSLESKIFQEQTAIVAVGAQVGGGKLGVDTSTLVDFNRSIIDRIIPIKDAPTAPEVEPDPQQQLDTLIKALSIITGYFNQLKNNAWGGDSDFLQDEADKYKNALKDIITFFKALGKSKTKNKAILPTVLSVTMDGISGIIIGNLFKINSDILPKGYKNLTNDGVGSKLGYIVTGIGHSIKSNDWVTTLEAQTIILENPKGMDIPFADMTLDISNTGPAEVGVVVESNGNTTAPVVTKPGKVTKSMTTFKEVATSVIANLEGGYYHPNMLNDGRVKDSSGYMAGIDPKTGKKIPGISPSGETMFGIDRVNGIGYRKGAPASWDKFWQLIADAGGPNKWRWNYIPLDPLRSQLFNFASEIMEAPFSDLLNKYVPEKEIQDVIKSDGRLYFNFVYALWNGPGWFKGWSKEVRAAYKNGQKDSEQLAALFVRRRTNNTGVIGNKKNNVLIAKSGAKISQLTGIA
jgi:hypothetical protein